MGLFKDYVSQTRKPEGFLGKMMVNGMNGGNPTCGNRWQIILAYRVDIIKGAE